ncbi:MAG TPA: MFS transporter [Gammaproteobacteria bacterium]|nr:MFS transporter [Gammaproteobacteria bacterium]
MTRPVNRQIISWALYDWANSAFAVTIMAGFFPVFFKQYWSGGESVTQSSFHLGIANSSASLVIVILAPLLGTIADQGSSKKRFLIFFALLGIVMTAALYGVKQGAWPVAMGLYILATIGFSGSIIFYDALMVDVTPRQHLDFVSGLGYACGYLGGGLLFALNVTMTLNPAWFGLADASEAVQWSFLMVAIWWTLFSVPLLLFVKEPRPTGVRQKPLAALRGAIRQLSGTFREIRRLRMVFLFLLSYWLYIDGVDTIIKMAVDYGMALGFESNSLIMALLITQFVGFPAAIAFGILGERLGAKTGIYLAIAIYLLVVIWASQMESEWEFYALAITIGLVQGGIQSLSRSFYARIIPADKAGEFFGFYNMLGRFAAIFGPVLMGWVSMATGNPRLSILAIAVLFVLGLSLLFFVDEQEGRHMAQTMDKN